MTKELQTVYVAVSVDERLPKESGTYMVKTYVNSEFYCFYEEPNDVWQLGKVRIFTKDTGITHWLQPTQVIVLSKEEWDGVKELEEALKAIKRLTPDDDDYDPGDYIMKVERIVNKTLTHLK